MMARTALAAICAAFMVACAQQPPEKQPPAVSVPVALIRSVCDQARPEQGGGHFDGHAHLLWSKDGAVVAVECNLTVMADGLSTAIVRVFLSDPRAQPLRDFLATHGAH